MVKCEYIKIPYQFNTTEEQLIRNNYKVASDWKNKKLDPVKANLRTYLRYLQNNVCCYCQQELGFDHRQVDIEHIVNKDDHEKFGFEPKNLVLSCPACNSCKTSQEILKNVDVVEYPSQSEAFMIVHPYFDMYSEHIEIKNNCLYVSNSDKGNETIRICKLNRLTNIEERRKTYLMKHQLVESLVHASSEMGFESKVCETIKMLIFDTTEMCQND